MDRDRKPSEESFQTAGSRTSFLGPEKARFFHAYYFLTAHPRTYIDNRDQVNTVPITEPVPIISCTPSKSLPSHIRPRVSTSSSLTNNPRTRESHALNWSRPGKDHSWPENLQRESHDRICTCGPQALQPSLSVWRRSSNRSLGKERGAAAAIIVAAGSLNAIFPAICFPMPTEI